MCIMCRLWFVGGGDILILILMKQAFRLLCSNVYRVPMHMLQLRQMKSFYIHGTKGIIRLPTSATSLKRRREARQNMWLER